MNSEEREAVERSVRGRTSRAAGGCFEGMIEQANRRYKKLGVAVIEKTPEPMKVLRPYIRTKGQFVACFDRKAQPDFKGVMAGGRCIIFDAKHTDSDRIQQNAVTPEQEKVMNEYESMNAICFILVSIKFQRFFRVPWFDWQNMKILYGHKFMTTLDLSPYEVKKEGYLQYLSALE